MTISFATQNAEFIIKQKPEFTPKFGLILGSGLGSLADEIEEATDISYKQFEGFGDCSVPGHSGVMTLGYLKGVPVACLRGRSHYYEGNDNITMQTPVYTLKAIGCETLIITNAAASLREEVPPGNIVLVNDHINFSFRNPLVGKNNDDFGPRFPAMANAYDANIRKQLTAIAHDLGIPLPEGVYLGVLGPCYETPAEIRAFKLLGADVLGMSTVPEVIVARHCGLKVAVISSVTNMASGMSDEELTHEGVLEVAKIAATKLIQLITRYMESLREIA